MATETIYGSETLPNGDIRETEITECDEYVEMRVRVIHKDGQVDYYVDRQAK